MDHWTLQSGAIYYLKGGGCYEIANYKEKLNKKWCVGVYRGDTSLAILVCIQNNVKKVNKK